MEIANLKVENAPPPTRVRAATTTDAYPINRLLQTTPLLHLHVDWQLPSDWLGEPGFVVQEEGPTAVKLEPTNPLRACLAATADPLPAAWVRIAAVANCKRPQDSLAAMLDHVLPVLRAAGVTELGWFSLAPWADGWLPDLGFACLNQVETYVKDDLTQPDLPDSPVVIRPVQAGDMPLLEAIEAAAFEPLWRHSAHALTLGWRQSISFDVALLDGRVIGFQYSAPGELGAHLCRITVHPDAQGMGAGSALMAAAIASYQRHGLPRVSLNTQVDNLLSHRLYEKFGFRPAGHRLPVWVMGV